jgi:hypothetical protein
MQRAGFARTAGVAVILTVVTVLSLRVLDAQVMSSPSYEIQSDSVNVGGGISTSTSYDLEDTIGEIATGQSDSSSFSLRAGYQQMQAVFLSMSTPDDVVMTPALGGLTGGTSNGSTTVTIITDSPAGYQLTIQAENNPSMQSNTSSIADYVPSGTADFSFQVNAGQAFFGFSPSGVHIPDGYKDNTSVCGVGSLDTALACWDGLSTTPTIVAASALRTSLAGATTTINFRVGIGSGGNVESGLYTATTTLTALPL